MSKDFLEACIKEQKELDDSMRESFKQRDERKARERTDSERLQDDLNKKGQDDK
jgi:hypothetical protein